MTAQEFREKYFIPGSPVIVCNCQELEIGARFGYIGNPEDGDDFMWAPNSILRQASFDEFLQTIKPELREWARGKRDPAYRYFYEISVD